MTKSKLRILITLYRSCSTLLLNVLIIELLVTVERHLTLLNGVLLKTLNELHTICEITKKPCLREVSLFLRLVGISILHMHVLSPNLMIKMLKLLWNVNSGFDAALSKPQ